jgi:plasmid maintenance system antidote protein VapI
MTMNPVHPGEILREDVLNELGLRLELAGVGTARAWLAMQTTYDLPSNEPSAYPRAATPDRRLTATREGICTERSLLPAH